MARLAFQDVIFGYGSEPVLRGVSLEVGPGEVVALLGPNGAGKTTALRLASGLLAPRTGRVTLDDAPVAGLDRRLAGRRLAGVPAEEDAPFPFTVAETVALGRHPWRGAFGRERPGDRAAVAAALEALDLVTLADRPLPSLSSGERRRAALARAVAQGGDLWLLDEPTAHLDLGHRLRVLEVVRAHAAAGGSALLSLHDLALAFRAADRVVLLVGGRVAATGPPEAVVTEATIREVFGAEVALVHDPVHGGPALLPLAPVRRDERP